MESYARELDAANTRVAALDAELANIREIGATTPVPSPLARRSLLKAEDESEARVQPPSATCGFRCDLSAYRWIFVLGVGRSGSTTILSMLNRLPGVELDGEHNGEAIARIE